MTGVSSSDVFYINDFENGANLDITLDMTHATLDQIRAAVTDIDHLRGSRFDHHRVRTTISVADATEVEYGGDGTHLNANQVSTDVVGARKMHALRPSTSIQWKHYNGDPSLELWTSENPDGDLRAAITALPDSPTHLYVRSADPGEQSSWDVTLPLAQKQMDDAVGIRDRLPVVVYQVDMRDGRISELSVGLGDPTAAAAHAVAVVSAVAPTTAHPLTVEWRLDGASSSEVSQFTACSTIGGASTAVPAYPSFASLKDWAATAPVGCSP